MKNDIYYMNLALKEAKKAIKYGDIPIGCVIVMNNKVISKAFNKKEFNNNPIKHAEIIAIEKASKKLNTWHLDECTLYTTMEPCLMCAGAILQSRISRIVYGLPNNNFGEVTSNNEVFKNNKKIKIDGCICEKESKSLVQSFFKNIR